MSNRIDPTDSSRPTVVKTGQFYWRQHRLAYERYGDAGSPRYSTSVSAGAHVKM